MLAEGLAGQSRSPPERFLVKGKELRVPRHPGAGTEHRLGQFGGQVGLEENGSRGKPRRQGEDDVRGAEGRLRFLPELPDTDGRADPFPPDPADRVVAPDGAFRDFFEKLPHQCHHPAGEPPGRRLHDITAHRAHPAIGILETAHSLFILTISMKTGSGDEGRHLRVDIGPVPGRPEIGMEPPVFGTEYSSAHPVPGFENQESTVPPCQEGSGVDAAEPGPDDDRVHGCFRHDPPESARSFVNCRPGRGHSGGNSRLPVSARRQVYRPGRRNQTSGEGPA